MQAMPQKKKKKQLAKNHKLLSYKIAKTAPLASVTVVGAGTASA
jgi:hypothetical protein